MAGVEAVVVIPARDEEQQIGACLEALAAQTVGVDAFEIIIVLDACRDRTEQAAAHAVTARRLTATTIAGPGAGTGPARRAGMEAACARLLALDRPDGLIASTDADTRPDPDWLERQLSHRDAGARVIAGRIELDAGEARELPAVVLRARAADAATRLSSVRRRDPRAAHHHFAGASLSITARAYREAGGLAAEPALEDEAFARRLDDRRIPVLRAADVRVSTSARTDGRAARGLSADLALADWMATRRYRAADYDVAALAAAAAATTISVIVPTRECAETIPAVLERAIGPARAAGLIDDVVVVDAASRDGTAERARAHGARVVQQDAIAAAAGPALGKGDAMWRGLQVTDGEIVCFMDGDTRDPAPEHLLGLIGPLLSEPGIALVKGAFDRPLAAGGERLSHEGGRVTELMARPLLNLHAPLLSGFRQPLAGEFAARRELLEAIAFPAGYGVEIAVLLDALARRGLPALAECDLGTRQNRHQSLRALGEMAFAVLAAMERRLDGPRSPISDRYVKPWADGEVAHVPIVERPPVREWRRSGAGGAGVDQPARSRISAASGAGHSSHSPVSG